MYENYRYGCKSCGNVTDYRDTPDNCICTVCGGGIEIVSTCRNIRQDKGDYNFVSESLAVPTHQIAEHRAMYPDVDVQKDGTLHFTSVAQQDRYYKRSGFFKQPQKNRSLGAVRIA